MKARALAVIGVLLLYQGMPVGVARGQVGTGLSVTPTCTSSAPVGGPVTCNITVVNVSSVAVDTLVVRSAFPRGATGTCGCPSGAPASCQLLPQVLRCCSDSDCISPQTCTGATAPQCHVVPATAVAGDPNFTCSSTLAPPGQAGSSTMCRSSETAIFPPGTSCVVGVGNNLMVTDAFGFGNATGTGLFASGTGQSLTTILCCGNGIVDAAGETCDTDPQGSVPTITCATNNDCSASGGGPAGTTNQAGACIGGFCQECTNGGTPVTAANACAANNTNKCRAPGTRGECTICGDGIVQVSATDPVEQCDRTALRNSNLPILSGAVAPTARTVATASWRMDRTGPTMTARCATPRRQIRLRAAPMIAQLPSTHVPVAILPSPRPGSCGRRTGGCPRFPLKA